MMAWKLIVTRKNHLCYNCGQIIPAGTRCMSNSVFGLDGRWVTRHICPPLTCHLPAEERRKYLAEAKGTQLSL